MEKHFIKVKKSLLNSYLFSRMTCIDRGIYISIFDWKTGSPGQIFVLVFLVSLLDLFKVIVRDMCDIKTSDNGIYHINSSAFDYPL